jgi:hypothetical protein
MAHTDVSKLFVGVPKVTGGIWRVPQTLVLPTDAFTARPGGSIRLGGVSDEGVTYTSERATTKARDWNGDKVRSLQTSKDDSFELKFYEFLNPNVLSTVHNTGDVTVIPASSTHGTQYAVRHVADVLDHGAYIVDSFDVGGVKHRRCFPDAQPDKIDPIVEKPGELAVYKVTFDLFPDSQGVTMYEYFELGDVLVPSVWDVAVAGSAGTFITTVATQDDTDDTATVAYNASTSAYDTALELLSTVGAGNATVTGTAGAYHVTLANGGTLSAVGSGGATVTVTPSS